MDRRAFIARLIGTGAVTWLGCGGEDGPPGGLDALLDGGLDGPPGAMPDAMQGAMPDAILDGFVDAADALADATGDATADAMSDASPVDCADPFAGGELLGRVPFTGGDPIEFHTLLREGWDGRLYTDLSLVDPERVITPTAEFYVRTRFPDLLDLDEMTPWTLAIDGLVAAPGDLALDALAPLVRPMGVHLMECSGNGRRAHFGLLSTCAWRGVPIGEVLDRVEALPGATRVEIGGFDRHSVPSVGGHSTPGASWIFTRAELERQGAFLATHMNGAPLPLDHGFPVRLVVPGWYGCTCIKWVDLIRLLPDDAPASGQMREFASRTHQDGVPDLARDYAPAAMDLAAMPIRIERWRVGGRVRHRVFGILWGGRRTTDRLRIRFRPEDPFEPVDVCPPMRGNATWTVWAHAWDAPGPGDYRIRCAIDDAMISTRRLDVGYYDRFVRLDG